MSLSFARLAAVAAATATLSFSAQALTLAEVAGSYSLTSVSTSMFQSAPTYWQLKQGVSTGIVKLNADGTFSVSGTESTNMMEAGAGSATNTTAAFKDRGNWSVIDDNTLRIDGKKFFISADNMVITGANASASDHSSIQNTLIRRK